MSEETSREAPIELDTSAKDTSVQAEGTCCPIVELRHYLHHPGRREELIALFDEYFISNTASARRRKRLRLVCIICRRGSLYELPLSFLTQPELHPFHDSSLSELVT